MSTILSLGIGSRQKVEEDPGLIPKVIHTQKLGRGEENSEIKENLSLCLATRDLAVVRQDVQMPMTLLFMVICLIYCH